jgi:hypothetical protein
LDEVASWTGHQPSAFSLQQRQFAVLVAWIVLGACKDPAPPGPSTQPIAVSGEATVLREAFGGDLGGWEPIDGSWQLRSDGDDRVLAQTATDRAFPVILWKSKRFSDVDVAVRLRPISGEVDASGGIAFRAQDGANYYVVRANSLEDNFRLYTVRDGNRRQIAGARLEKPEIGKWHRLRVVAVGDHIQAYLDERLLIDHRDGTFAEGWVGLWTKADAVTEFDDVEVRGIATAPDRTGSGSPVVAPPTKRSSEPAVSPPASRISWTFEDTEAGKLPNGWSAPVGRWSVAETESASRSARVLAQDATSASPIFNIAFVEASSYADVDLSVRLQSREGRIDQGGGVVWRAKDHRNYYIARYNPLEDNYRVYTVEDGRRRQIGSADVELDHRAWHTLRVKMVGDHIECFLNAQKHLDVRDGTFIEAGMIGLWTKADARTWFDELTVEHVSKNAD